MSTFKLTSQQRRDQAKKATVTIDEDEDQQQLDNMDEYERAEYEETIREQIRKGINTFITHGTFDEEVKQFKAELPMQQLAGAKPHVKCALFVAKLYRKFNTVSERIISSYNWELNRNKVIPKDPGLYRKMLQEELQLDGAQLVDKFVSFLAAEDAKKRNSLKDWTASPRAAKEEAGARDEVSRSGVLKSVDVGAQESAVDSLCSPAAFEAPQDEWVDGHGSGLPSRNPTKNNSRSKVAAKASSPSLQNINIRSPGWSASGSFH